MFSKAVVRRSVSQIRCKIRFSLPPPLCSAEFCRFKKKYVGVVFEASRLERKPCPQLHTPVSGVRQSKLDSSHDPPSSREILLQPPLLRLFLYLNFFPTSTCKVWSNSLQCACSSRRVSHLAEANASSCPSAFLPLGCMSWGCDDFTLNFFFFHH